MTDLHIQIICQISIHDLIFLYSKEKFSDIVEWLKANAVKGESSPSTGSPTAEKKTEIEHKNTDVKLFQGQTNFAPISATTSSATSWTSGAFFNHQTPSIFGNYFSSIATSWTSYVMM